MKLLDFLVMVSPKLSVVGYLENTLHSPSAFKNSDKSVKIKALIYLRGKSGFTALVDRVVVNATPLVTWLLTGGFNCSLL